MRRLSLLLAAGLIACAVSAPAEPEIIPLKIVLGTATAGTNSSTRIEGYIEEIQVAVSDGVSTGSVIVAVQPSLSTVAAYNIATNAVSDEKRWHPARDFTDINGAAVTGDEPRRYFLAGDTVKFSVTGSPTNVTWTAYFKTNDR